jgi:hypothetical protein
MASSGKKKTTMAKLTRESRLRERRMIKQAKKDARRRASAERADGALDAPDATVGEPADASVDRAASGADVETGADA